MSVASNEIQVFPSTARNAEYIDNKIISETNLTRIVRNSTILEGNFIITKEYDSDIEFYLGGYYFKYSGTIPGSGTDEVYAVLTFFDENENELKGDGGNGYEGLTITNDKPDENSKYMLLGKWGDGTFTLNSDRQASTLRDRIVNMKSYFIGPDSQELIKDPSKLWVDTTESSQPILRYYQDQDNGQGEWIKLGAVYK